LPHAEKHVNSSLLSEVKMRSFSGRDILSLKEFERQEFFHVFDVAAELEPIAVSRRNDDLLAEKTLVTAFYQPSTRTRLAHEAAMHRLGGHVSFGKIRRDPQPWMATLC
jgi:aspartate carbamoyltransferase catalytic subunit